MKPSYELILIILLILSTPIYAQKVNGVSFVAATDSITISNVTPVVSVHANYVSLMPFGFVRQLDDPSVFFNSNSQWYGETVDGVIQYTSVVRKEGLKVMVKPQIWVANGQFTGKLQMNTEEDWVAFEQSYCDFILTYAKLAEDLNAEIFCIGTELEQFVMQRPYFWKELIKEIKTITESKLTYAANWDEYKRISFWHQLDYIGIDAYFPLSNKKSPTLDEIVNSWQPIKKEIQDFSKSRNTPILFTEYGYRSIDFALKEPWQANRVKGSVNLEIQLEALEAIHTVFWDEEWFAGGFLWKWFVHHDHVGGLENNRFTVQNKPAEKKLKELHLR